jgi:hypothetical protein
MEIHELLKECEKKWPNPIKVGSEGSNRNGKEFTGCSCVQQAEIEAPTDNDEQPWHEQEKISERFFGSQNSEETTESGNDPENQAITFNPWKQRQASGVKAKNIVDNSLSGCIPLISIKRTRCGEARYALVIPKPELKASSLRVKMMMRLETARDWKVEIRFSEAPDTPVANFR